MRSDEKPITITDLCREIGINRSTYYAMRSRGYRPQFGTRTSLRHFLNWWQDSWSAGQPTTQADPSALEAQLTKLR